MRPPWKALNLLAGVLMRDRSKGGHVTRVAGIRGTRPRGPECLQPSAAAAQDSPMSPNFYMCGGGRGGGLTAFLLLFPKDQSTHLGSPRPWKPEHRGQDSKPQSRRGARPGNRAAPRGNSSPKPWLRPCIHFMETITEPRPWSRFGAARNGPAPEAVMCLSRYAEALKALGYLPKCDAAHFLTPPPPRSLGQKRQVCGQRGLRLHRPAPKEGLSRGRGTKLVKGHPPAPGTAAHCKRPA